LAENAALKQIVADPRAEIALQVLRSYRLGRREPARE
jgi:hypothetical protein